MAAGNSSTLSDDVPRDQGPLVGVVTANRIGVLSGNLARIPAMSRSRLRMFPLVAPLRCHGGCSPAAAVVVSHSWECQLEVAPL